MDFPSPRTMRRAIQRGFALERSYMGTTIPAAGRGVPRRVSSVAEEGWAGRLRGDQACDRQQIGGEHTDPDVGVEGRKRMPEAACKADCTLEKGDVRLGSG